MRIRRPCKQAVQIHLAHPQPLLAPTAQQLQPTPAHLLIRGDVFVGPARALGARPLHAVLGLVGHGTAAAGWGVGWGGAGRNGVKETSRSQSSSRPMQIFLLWALQPQLHVALTGDGQSNGQHGHGAGSAPATLPHITLPTAGPSSVPPNHSHQHCAPPCASLLTGALAILVGLEDLGAAVVPPHLIRHL